MRKKFRCLHCGSCCEKPYSQISLTLGDVIRLSEQLKKPVEALFAEGLVGIMPFFCSDTRFGCELGLKKPCTLRIDKRCVAYKARPLNCRLFPIWLLAELAKEKLKEHVDESYLCVHFVELDDETKERYRIYTKRIAEILDKEAELTEGLLKKLFLEYNLEEEIDLSLAEGFGELDKRIKKRGESTIQKKKEADNARVGFALKIIDKLDYKRIFPKVIKEIRELRDRAEFTSIGELEIMEKGMDNQ